MESESGRLLADLLPKEWLVREYRPDYGLDLAVETFAPAKDDPTMYETLGEHFFIQLKSVERVEWKRKTVYGRINVEKVPLQPTTNPEHTADIDVAAFQLETSELETVAAMGPAIPVLLVLADLSDRTAYHLCLNDYIDKVLEPEDSDWRSKSSKVVHVPRLNRIDPAAPWTVAPIAFYARRPKLFAAFLKFGYQRHELCAPWRNLASLDEDELRWLVRMGAHFHRRIERLDIWDQDTIWSPLRDMAAAIRSAATMFAESGSEVDPAKLPRPTGFTEEEWENIGGTERMRALLSSLCRHWERLENLGRMYEELCREWFMPTYLAQLLSYPDSDQRLSSGEAHDDIV